MITSKLFMLIFFLLLLIPNVSVIAHECVPACTPCQTCEAGVCVDDDDLCDDCQYCYMGTCMPYGDCGGGCPACESCVSCWCQCTSECCQDSDCTGECHNGCSNCSCVDDNTECEYFDCEICNGGMCEDKCPALGKHCLTELGLCVECRDVLDCELCEECDDVMHTCEHPCDDCDPPKYCGYACVCVECYYGEEDTTTCSTANSTTECDCSINIINPCSSPGETIIYSGNSIKSCTGPDCDSVKVLCYTTYPKCKTNGSVQPLKWCGGDVLPPTCVIDVYQPGPGCYTCVNSFESGLRAYEYQGDCPIEDWPE